MAPVVKYYRGGLKRGSPVSVAQRGTNACVEPVITASTTTQTEANEDCHPLRNTLPLRVSDDAFAVPYVPPESVFPVSEEPLRRVADLRERLRRMKDDRQRHFEDTSVGVVELAKGYTAEHRRRVRAEKRVALMLDTMRDSYERLEQELSRSLEKSRTDGEILHTFKVLLREKDLTVQEIRQVKSCAEEKVAALSNRVQHLVFEVAMLERQLHYNACTKAQEHIFQPSEVSPQSSSSGSCSKGDKGTDDSCTHTTLLAPPQPQATPLFKNTQHVSDDAEAHRAGASVEEIVDDDHDEYLKGIKALRRQLELELAGS
jgi:hypothetical protein